MEKRRSWGKNKQFIDRAKSIALPSWNLLKSRIADEWHPWPEWIENSNRPLPLARVNENIIRVTLLSHSSFLIQIAGYNIITDPIYSQRCSPYSFVGPKRRRDPGISFADLPKIDVVIISHDHYDHLDLPTIRRLVARDDPKLYMGLGVSQHLNSTHNVVELDWWESSEFASDFRLTFVPVQHFSGRGLFDQFTTLWGGYVLEINDKKIYFGGDSGYADHYKETYKKFGEVSLALLPIGSYAPRNLFGSIHLDPREAIQAHIDLQARLSIGMHYGTFRLTAEQIDEPPKLLEEEKIRYGLSTDAFVILEFGHPFCLT